jgi:4-diphosphocytidyl-2-C-methyl-D-erythritol kinase
MIVRPTADGVEVLAPAKLNLFLEIHGRRADGYHDLESLMVTVDLYDTLTFVDDPSGRITLRCDDATLPNGDDNLVVRAAKAVKVAVGCDRGVSIELKKAIPAQAGLAGGSSDAAATLTALDLLWDLRMPSGQLDALAGSIGSDVAFFRHGPTAVCRGRGEQVEPRPIPRSLTFVLVCPPFGVSTADVYRQLTPPERPRPIGPFLEALAGGDTRIIGASLFNRLQPIAETLCPALNEVRDALASVGSDLDGHLMSGSGSAYFGLARDHAAARSAADRLAGLGPGKVRVVTSCP